MHRFLRLRFPRFEALRCTAFLRFCVFDLSEYRDGEETAIIIISLLHSSTILKSFFFACGALTAYTILYFRNSSLCNVALMLCDI